MTTASSPPLPSSRSDDWGDFVSASPPTTPPPSISPPPSMHISPNSSPPTHPPPSPSAPPAASPQSPTSDPASLPGPQLPQPLKGFDTLDPVQRYAVGALAVVLLNYHANDLNGAAFARTQAAVILHALQLSSGQQTALLALEPASTTRHEVVAECVNLVGDRDARFLALQAMLALAVATGKYDARSRAFLASVASEFSISWRAVAAVELAVAIQLFENAAQEQDHLETDNRKLHSVDEAPEGSVNHVPENRPKSVDELLIERRKKKMRVRKAIKISGITLVGGMLFGLTGGLIAPALLSALAGVGVASAAGLAASGTLASGAVVGGLFGVAGAGFTVKKARNRISTSLEEFDFERPDDPRVIDARKRKEERRRRKLEKLVAERLAEEAAAADELKRIEAPSDRTDDGLLAVDAPAFDAEKELPRPPEGTDEDEDEDEDEEDDDESTSKKHKRFGMRKKKKKRSKQRVGSRGLEAAAQIPSLHVCICVPAWLTEKAYGASLDQFELGLKAVLPCSQHIALRWESRRLYEMGLAFAKFWASKATVTTVQQAYPHAIAAASTVAGAVAFAFAIPLTVMSCMDYIDNPWSILVSRSNGAGDELADVLVERSYGHRPVTLFGYSIGARVIFKCLESLASRGALGIVDSVFVMGAAITADPERWKKIRPVVAGRIVNAYGSYDWALAFFHRGCGHGVYVSGLRRVEVDGVENLNMAYLGIEGHRELKDCVPRVMRAMGVGVGYIVMPPARLVHKRRRSKNQQRKEDSPVYEDPVDGEDSSDCLSAGPSDNHGSHDHDHLASMRDDEFWVSETREEAGAAGGSRGRRTDTLPPCASSSESALVFRESLVSPEASGDKNHDSGKAKKSKKSKSWLSWSSWSSQRKKVASPEIKPEKPDAKVQNEGFSIHGHDFGRTTDSSSESEHIPARDGDHMNDIQNGQKNGDAQVADESDDGSGELDVEMGGLDEPEPFDWEKQRRIWEEQERQIQERGFADPAEEIEMQGKVVLNISIEVAGRRLFRFVTQDAELPIARKEEIYTNCVEDQRGVLVRIYEHEKRTKSVAMNMLKRDEEYPKLLGELDVHLRSAAEKGKLRIAVSMEVDRKGDVYAFAEERFGDGNVGDRDEIRMARGELCTMVERERLERAERKRLEAQLQKEMRNRNSQTLPALPAPEKDERGATVIAPSDAKADEEVRQ